MSDVYEQILTATAGAFGWLPSLDEHGVSESVVLAGRTDYTVLEELYLGQSHIARCVRSGDPATEGVVCKITDWDLMSKDEKRKKKVVDEISTLVHLARVREHPHICQLADVCLLRKAAEENALPRSFLYLVYPWYGPSLKTLLEKKSAAGLPAPVALRLLLQLTDAVQYVHSQGLCHRDIKSENICTDDTFESLVLIDFDYATNARDNSGPLQLTSAVGSLGFLPPEMFTADSYDGQAGDIWSAGMTLLEVVFGLEWFQKYVFDIGPFDKRCMNDLDFFQSRSLKLLRNIKESSKSILAADDKASLLVASLLKEILTLDPQRRPTAAALFANLSEAAHAMDFNGDIVVAPAANDLPVVDRGFAELHVHLDGSMRPETFLQLYNALPTEQKPSDGLVFASRADVFEKLGFRRGWDLPRCLQCFSTTLLVLQTSEALTRVTFELCEDLFIQSNVTYGEIRYCPSLHRQSGLTDDEIVEAVHMGLRRAMELYPSTKFYQIITVLRDFGTEEALVMTQLACKHGLSKLVVGVDLAGNEVDHPPEKFVDAFSYAHERGMGITIHAGEGSSQEAEDNIVTSVEKLHATRIGHGVAARRSKNLQDMLSARGITIEICPSSNVHTGSIANLGDHPARSFFEHSVRIVPCCDNSLLSQTNTRKEYSLLQTECGFTRTELSKVASDAHLAAFGPKHE